MKLNRHTIAAIATAATFAASTGAAYACGGPDMGMPTGKASHGTRTAHKKHPKKHHHRPIPQQ